MDNIRPVKIVRISHNVGFIIPKNVAQQLGILRGEYFDLVISDKNTMVARRLKIIPEGEFGEVRDKKLPIIKHGK